MKCKQNGCSEFAAVRYTWPGRDESVACITHAVNLKGVADAMGLHLQLIPLTVEDFIAHANKPEAQP